MLGQVIIGSVRHAPQLTPAKGEQEFDIRGSLGIEAELLSGMIAGAHLLFLHAESLKPVDAEGFPVREPLQIGAGLAEKFQLHLLKLSGTEGEVARCDLVAEGFSDLADAEGNLLAGGSLYIFEIHENALCCLRP